MKGIQSCERVYVEQFDVHVKPYLSYSEIQSIANAVRKFDTWAERATQKDMLILLFATDVDREAEDDGSYVLSHTHQEYLESGLIEAVKKAILNLDKIDEAIDYMESTERSLVMILRELPNYFKPLQDVINKHSKVSK